MILFGLGNPGKEYANTHHNMGYMFVDKLASYYNVKFKLNKKFQAEVAEIIINDQKHYLVKPITYMNLSGLSVRLMLEYYNIDIANILVISDDLDLPLGTLRIRKTGGSGGHRGIASIIQETKTNEFARIRIGIGRSDSVEVVDYVLSKFSKSEMNILNETFDKAPNIFNDYLQNGIDYVMNNYNGVKK